MNDELIKQIHQNIYNDNMLYSLYNILDDEGYLTQLRLKNNEVYCVEDFKWTKINLSEDDKFNTVYRGLKNYVENNMDGLKKGVFIIKKDLNIYCVKLKA